jgi:hypothetical protein
VVEEPAHAAAPAVVAATAVIMAVEAEGVTAVMTAAMAAVVVIVSSKHFELDPISLYRNSRYIGFEIRQERISIYLMCNRNGLGSVAAREVSWVAYGRTSRGAPSNRARNTQAAPGEGRINKRGLDPADGVNTCLKPRQGRKPETRGLSMAIRGQPRIGVEDPEPRDGAPPPRSKLKNCR